jgi:hypothetical protein
MFINIHHYFTDGVIWKLRNPEVRRELFAHVPAPKAREERGAEPARRSARRGAPRAAR